ncbi:MAG TPA: gamma-glutamylcyclotransferase family protein [Terriglobales bacterium]|jgi:gamma-glutamylcyclotransferase (GGCT)/AIG2-like uncharacterized protein YtfP|nr:gamma-glutamylcyclotransferase family protein [Terriglobales bacterium]
MRKSRNGRAAKRYLFSYGTLSPRLAPPEIEPTVRRFRRVGRGFVHGQLFDLGEYPGAILSRNGSRIVGQIFELPDDPEVLNRLDEYEGFNRSDPKASLFVRKRRYVQLQDGRKIFCWIYSYNRPVKSAQRLGEVYKKGRSRSAS